MPDGPTVDIWYARPERFSADTLRRFQRSLSPDEQSRAARFLSDDARRLFVAARGAARHVLGHALDVSPAACRFAYHGTRPHLQDPVPPADGFDFNISHTTGLIAIAIARGMPGIRVGVDVESVSRPWRPDLPARFFSPAEARSIAALPEQRRQDQFYGLWTLKEAYLKARGDGLTGQMSQFTVHLADGAAPSLQPVGESTDDSSRWHLTLNEPASGYLLALAVNAALPRVSLSELTC